MTDQARRDGKADDRVPAEVFPPSVFIGDELKARGWTEENLIERLHHPMDRLSVMLILHVNDKHIILDPRTANALGAAFDVSPQFFLNLDAAWRGVEPLQGAQPKP